jgi:hypothetical protein
MINENSQLTFLVGKQITEDLAISGKERQIRFDDDDTTLSIYNTHVTIPPAAALTGRKVQSVHNGPIEFRLILDGEVSLAVDLRDDAFNGPEAMVLVVAGQLITVWN